MTPATRAYLDTVLQTPLEDFVPEIKIRRRSLRDLDGRRPVQKILKKKTTDQDPNAK